MSREPWLLDGPTPGSLNRGLEDALRRLHLGRPGPPRDADRPQVSLFPMTRAAREALRLSRGS